MSLIDYRIGVFSGGSGTQYLHRALSSIPALEVAYFVNGYDSGLSTGRIRWAVPGLLGPSDYRKSIVTCLANSGSENDRALADLIDFRLPKDAALASQELKDLSVPELSLDWISRVAPNADIERIGFILKSISRFTRYLAEHDLDFDGSDLAIGNAVIAGSFLLNDRSFNDAIESICRSVLPHDAPAILNVTNGEDLWLAAVTEDDYVTFDEGVIVEPSAPSPICELLLLPRAVAAEGMRQNSGWAQLGRAEISRLGEASIAPKANPRVIEFIKSTQTIIYGTGTQHSSLLPSYLTLGIRDAIEDNEGAAKILLINSSRDADFTDSQDLDVVPDLVQRYLGSIDRTLVIDNFWSTTRSWNKDHDAGLPGLRIIGAHRLDESVTDASVYQLLANSIRLYLGSELKGSENAVSVIVPVLNEIDRLPSVIQMIEEWKPASGEVVQIVVIDGGSSDGTWEWIAEQENITVGRVSGRHESRAEAISLGLDMSRGARVILFHGDGEYQIEDADKMLAVVGSAKSMALGSRVHGAVGASALRIVYRGQPGSYWISRLGGLLATTILSVRIGRVVSDPFCGFLCAQRDDLRRVFPKKGDLSGFVGAIVNANQAQIQIHEIGVRYVPRTRAEGKKTRMHHGIAALLRAIAPAGMVLSRG